MSYRFADSLRAGSGRNQFRPDPARNDIYHCCVYSEKFLMMDRGNSPKHVEFYSKNKFEKLVHLVGFVIRIYHDALSPERTVGFIIRIYHDARSPEHTVGFIIGIYHDALSPERTVGFIIGIYHDARSSERQKDVQYYSNVVRVYKFHCVDIWILHSRCFASSYFHFICIVGDGNFLMFFQPPKQ